MPLPRATRCCLAIVLGTGLAACHGEYSSNSYAPGAVQQVSKVDRAVIESYRVVDISQQGLGSGIGAGAGAAAGGIAGSQAGRGGGNAAATLAGVLVGGVIGALAENAMTETQAFEYIVRKANGDLLSVTQKDAQPLPVGQKVLVIYGVQARIIPDDGGQSPSATSAPVKPGG